MPRSYLREKVFKRKNPPMHCIHSVCQRALQRVQLTGLQLTLSHTQHQSLYNMGTNIFWACSVNFGHVQELLETSPTTKANISIRSRFIQSNQTRTNPLPTQCLLHLGAQEPLFGHTSPQHRLRHKDEKTLMRHQDKAFIKLKVKSSSLPVKL